MPMDLLKLYYFMKLTRECDDAILRLYRQGKIVGGAYTGAGNEATAVGSASTLASGDYLFPMHRDLGAHLVKGQSLRNIFLQQLGRRDSLTRGRDSTGHYADPRLRLYGNVSHLGAMIPMAVGVALAAKMRDEHAVVMTYIGDGGSSTGEFHEGLNMAAVMRLPFVLIIENNQYAYSTPVGRQFAARRLSDRAAGYGIPGVTIDGTDVEAVQQACAEAVEDARSGRGPALIESVTMRLQGHSASDDASYVPPDVLQAWKEKDPLLQCEGRLIGACLLTPERKTAMEQEIAAAVRAAIEEAEASPSPLAGEADGGVYA